MIQPRARDAICPFCRTAQDIGDAEVGGHMYCRKCGSRFQVTVGGLPAAYPVIGKLAVTYKFITEAQLKEALGIQAVDAAVGKQTTLEEILVKHDYIAPKGMKVLLHVKRFLDTRRLDKQFGDIAIKKTFVSSADVEKGLQRQSEHFKQDKAIRKLGDLLVDAGVMKTRQRDEILTLQKRGEIAQSGPPLSTAIPADAAAGAALSKIAVAPDALKAYLCIGAADIDILSLETVKQRIQESGVCHGVISDETIQSFLAGEKKIGDRFQIAAGTPARAAQNAAVAYFFEIDYLQGGCNRRGWSDRLQGKRTDSPSESG